MSWSHESDLGAGPRYHLWGRIGDGKIFRFGADTQTLAAGERGRLQICIYHGTWASPDGTLATPHAVYDSLAGGIEVLVIRWGDVAPDRRACGARFSGAFGPPHCSRMHASRFCSRAAPGVRAPLTGRSDIFYGAEGDGAPVIALRADANAGIVRRPIDVALRPDISLEWTWRVNALPSRVREDAFATHDYASIALFDDGRDLTWYWSAALPVGHHYRCPLPRWRESETHVGARSGPQRLGVWIDERNDVQTDVARALSRAPSKIVALWLIGLSLFQCGHASVVSVASRSLRAKRP